MVQFVLKGTKIKNTDLYLYFFSIHIFNIIWIQKVKNIIISQFEKKCLLQSKEIKAIHTSVNNTKSTLHFPEGKPIRYDSVTPNF